MQNVPPQYNMHVESSIGSPSINTDSTPLEQIYPVTEPASIPIEVNTERLEISSNIITNPSNCVDNSACTNLSFSNIIDLPIIPSSTSAIIEEPIEQQLDENVSSPNKNCDQSQMEHINSTEPKIPLSHLNATNQYPSLNRIPPAGIVQSFSPVSNQSNFQTYQQQQGSTTENENEELYNSYANNPYNLTLQIDQNFSNVTPTTVSSNQPFIDTSNAGNSNVSNLNVFRSVNYFGAASDATIPPGSEVLFGGP